MRVAVYLGMPSAAGMQEIARREVGAFVERRGWKVTETYVATEPSANASHEHARERMLRDARLTQFEAIVVWELTCLVRNSRELVTLLRQLGQLHVRLVAVRHGFDTDSGVGEDALRVATLFGKIDRQARADHVRVGLERAREAGRRIGRPPRNLDQTVLSQLRGDGKSIRQIARYLGVASSTVARHLKAGGHEGSDPRHPRPGGAHE
jgi:DNA invertase Pin-like site-specific DNA recombinase